MINTSPLSALKKIFIHLPYKGGIHKFTPDQIVRLEADSNYTQIYFTDHRPIIMAKVLSDYEEMLIPFGFLRTHRSHLVNKKHIEAVDDSGLHMKDSSTIEISRRKKRDVLREVQFLPQAA
jgi:two-component system LytT family response regulator